jgi:hypothetical protein
VIESAIMIKKNIISHQAIFFLGGIILKTFLKYYPFFFYEVLWLFFQNLKEALFIYNKDF